MKELKINLQGAFKVDLFDKNGKFVESTDYFSNFITTTGLLYPLRYAFADCFRYLSLGTDPTASIVGDGAGDEDIKWGTTGVKAPIVTYTTNVGTEDGIDIDWKAYETSEDPSIESFCGTQFATSGIRLFRGWRVPSGLSDGMPVTMQEPGTSGLMIEEFAVAPNSGACAFSRVTRPVFIPNDFSAVISYQLIVNLPNMRTPVTFPTGTFKTGNADVTNFELVRQWSFLSGYYRQVYHGLKCVDTVGASYIERYGDGLEPSTRNLRNLFCYLSPDNFHFDVNTSGGNQLNITEAWKANGLRTFLGTHTNSNSLENLDPDARLAYYTGMASTGATSLPTIPLIIPNIRIGSVIAPLQLANLSGYNDIYDDPNFNYQVTQDDLYYPISYATPGAAGWDDNQSNYKQRYVASSRTTQYPYQTTTELAITGRSKSVVRKMAFSPVSSFGYNTRFGSLVYAFKNPAESAPNGEAAFYPIIDCLFYDTSGQSLAQHYRYVTGIYWKNRGRYIEACNLHIEPEGDNITKMTEIRTINSPYMEDYSLHPEYDYTSISEGPVLTISDSGWTGSFGNNTLNGYTGIGSVLGILQSGTFCQRYFDIGLAPHRTGMTAAYPSSGYIYWKNAATGGNPISVVFDNIDYCSPQFYLGTVTTGQYSSDSLFRIRENNTNGYWIGMTGSTGNYRQVIADVRFSNEKSGSNLKGLFVRTGINYPWIFGNQENWTTDFVASGIDNVSGFYLYNTGVKDAFPTGSGFAANLSALTNNPIGSVYTDGVSYWISGYFIYSGIPVKANSLITEIGNPQKWATKIYVKAENQLHASCNDCLKVTGIDNGYGWIDKLHSSGPYWLLSSGAANPTLIGYGIVMVTGLAQTYFGWSNLTGSGMVTDFRAPVAYPAHIDGLREGDAYTPCQTEDYGGEENLVELVGPTGFRLMPNYGEGNLGNPGDPNYYLPTIGGAYPALSPENALDVYLNITWSSPCAGAKLSDTSNCVDR